MPRRRLRWLWRDVSIQSHFSPRFGVKGRVCTICLTFHYCHCASKRNSNTKSSQEICCSQRPRESLKSWLYAGYNSLPQCPPYLELHAKGQCLKASRPHVRSLLIVGSHDRRHSSSAISDQFITSTPTNLFDDLPYLVLAKHGSHPIAPCHLLQAFTDLSNVDGTGEVQWM